jgi:hypothetical protein
MFTNISSVASSFEIWIHFLQMFEFVFYLGFGCKHALSYNGYHLSKGYDSNPLQGYYLGFKSS